VLHDPKGSHYKIWRGSISEIAKTNLSKIKQPRIIKEESKSVREILVGISQGQNEMRKETAKARREMAEAIKFLGQLIVSESEKTRQMIKS
jgi:hypothetical protein